MKHVEVLFFDGCPHADAAIENARRAIDAARVEAELRLVRVTDEETAARERCLGSPTVRIDGVDVDPSARERTDFGLQCRVYSAEGGRAGAPPVAWIRAALIED